MLKVLVTGATGFIGRHLVPQLLSDGYDVRCAVWKKVDWLTCKQFIINKLESDINWSEALEDVDIVIHLAARVHILKEKAELSFDEFCKVNSEATRNFALQAARNKVKRFIFLSTIKVNGELTSDNLPFIESQTPAAIDPYAKSKLLAEQYLQEICQDNQMEYVILRPPLVYGPGVKANFLKLLKLASHGWPLPFANVSNKRSLIFIDNLISAIQAVIFEPKAANQLFLVADDEVWSIGQLLRSISVAMNKKVYLFPLPYKSFIFILNKIGLGAFASRIFGSLQVSNQKIKEVLNWSPPVISDDGIKKTVEWYEHNC